MSLLMLALSLIEGMNSKVFVREAVVLCRHAVVWARDMQTHGSLGATRASLL